MEKAFRIIRSHGGAVSVKDQFSPQLEIPYAEREILHAVETRRIAKEAVSLIVEKNLVNHPL